MKVELAIGTAAGADRWMLKALYQVPLPSNPNAAMDGPQITKQGAFTTSTVQRFGGQSTVFRLNAGDGGTSLRFAQIGADILNLAADDGSLVAGTPAWSYTLTRADRVEPPVEPVYTASEGSYTVPPRETGPQVFGVFGGRSPCGGLARMLELTNASGCVRLKWRVTLLQDPNTHQPTTYKAGSSYTRDREWTGTWRIVRGAAGLPDATVYQLDGDASRGPIFLLRVDDLVFFLNQQRQPLPGNADLSYTLTKSSQ